MLRFKRAEPLALCVLALPLLAACPQAEKDRVCREYRDVMSQWGDPADHAKKWRRGASVLEGLRGVPEVDAYRRDVERMADVVERMHAQLQGREEWNADFMTAYHEVHAAMSESGPAFLEFCFGG